MILFKMLTRGVISEINGCISTGKEVSINRNHVMAFSSAGWVEAGSAQRRIEVPRFSTLFVVLLDWYEGLSR